MTHNRAVPDLVLKPPSGRSASGTRRETCESPERSAGVHCETGFQFTRKVVVVHREFARAGMKVPRVGIGQVASMARTGDL